MRLVVNLKKCMVYHIYTLISKKEKVIKEVLYYLLNIIYIVKIIVDVNIVKEIDIYYISRYNN